MVTFWYTTQSHGWTKKLNTRLTVVMTQLIPFSTVTISFVHTNNDTVASIPHSVTKTWACFETMENRYKETNLHVSIPELKFCQVVSQKTFRSRHVCSLRPQWRWYLNIKWTTIVDAGNTRALSGKFSY